MAQTGCLESSSWARSSPPTTSSPPARCRCQTTTTADPDRRPRRAVRPKTAAEKAFCSLGEVAEAFIKDAAAAGHQLARRPEGARRDRGRLRHDALPAAVERAVEFSRFRAHDVSSIIAAGMAVHRPAAPGEALVLDLPIVADASALGLRHRRLVVSAPPPALPADFESGLRRLRLSAMRKLSPELLVSAKTQRWSPEEFLRTLIEAEIASRDASNVQNRRGPRPSR